MSEPTDQDTADRAIAIVAVSAILPDAADVTAFWDNVKAGRYSISQVPPDRWDVGLYYDDDPAAPDKAYSKLGGWVRDWEWEPLKWHLPIPPKVADAMDESQRWVIACARTLLHDYGHPERPLDLQRTAVVLGSAMAGEMHYKTSLRVHVPRFVQALEATPEFAALPAGQREAIAREVRERMSAELPPITEDSMPGELANCMAGRVANLFDLHGPNFVCDAACAAALAAIDAAVEGLVEHEYDAAVVGGVDRNMGPEPFVKFCKIGALSATGTRPYADGADGFVMGEGAALFLLKRLADAERDGDRIYAVLRGIGGASDGKGKGITAPNPVGQRLAIERAWANAGLSPASVGLIEGHGTSTRVGDVVEVESLNAVFGTYGLPRASVPLGSVKSNIGHLKGAAGAAGLLKATLALHEKVLPPSLNFERPNPNIDFEATPFYVNTELKPWDAPADGVRRAGVSAFGFGGTNFHAVLEEYIPGRLKPRARSSRVAGAEQVVTNEPIELKPPLRGALLIGAPDARALQQRLETVARAAHAGQAPAPAPPDEAALRAAERIAIDYGDAAELAARADRALKAFDADQPAAWKMLRAQGVFRGSGPAPKVAFLYTGQGSQYPNMLRSLREREPLVADVFTQADARMAGLIDGKLSEIIFPDPDDADAVARAEQQLKQTEITQPAVLAVDAALTTLLTSYGVQPDFVMGHSLGEYGGLVASGALPLDDALEAVSARGREMASLTIEDNGRMAAVMAPLEQIQEVMDSIDGNVVIANINSTSQAVIGGATAAVEQAMDALRERGADVIPLPVSHAFHTSIVAPASEPLRQTLTRLALAPPSLPIVSNVTGEFYPMHRDAVPEMIDLLGKQVASPVQFVKGLHKLYDAGARVFVEVGPKRALQGFADDVLGDRPDVVALFTNHPKTGDLPAFNQALCGLYAAGLGVGAAAAVERVPEVAPRAVEAPARAALAAPAPVAAAPPASAGALPEERYQALGRLFAEFMERGSALYRGGAAPASTTPTVVTGVGLGLPGAERVFDDLNTQRIVDGTQGIDVIPGRFRRALVDKHITRLVKSESGSPHFENIEDPSEVIKLAARAGAFDLEAEFGVPAGRIPALDIVTKLAMAVGLEALRDAGIPLVMHYRTTTKGTQLPERWMLPDELRDDTGVIFAAAFPGMDSFADELTRFHADQALRARLQDLQSLRERAVESSNGHDVLRQEIDRRIHELEQEIEREPYAFDRRFLFRVLAMGHSQFAEYVGARGPNTHVNAACASTTQAFAVAEDWIHAGRCRRVVVVAADDVTSDNLIEWIGSGFLATGAAATDEVVEEAALPFDRRRHGMILGMGAAGVVIESAEAAAERGLRPICEVLSTVTANSAFHGTRLDVEHITQVMERLVSSAEVQHGIDRGQIARSMVFMSHETYTPARGGSAAAEINALRHVFGAEADSIVVANTKGFTGHPMGVGIEDVVAIRALETGTVPPVPNLLEPDPDLGSLHLSKGGAYDVHYALRLGAGFGSQISMSLLRWIAPPDGRRASADQLGHAYRIADRAAFDGWLRRVSGDAQPELEVVARTLRLRDRGPAARVAPPAAAATAPASPVSRVTPSAPAPAASAAAPVSEADDGVRARVMEIVAEQTGYPSDMLELDLDLEADLGIDTVKQAETFAAIRAAYGIERDDSLKLRDYPTIAHVISFVHERRTDVPASAPAPAAPAAAPAGEDDGVRARVMEIVAEQTGYPSDMLELDLDLEADLGIDTVKQAETFAAIRAAYGIERDDSLKLRDYPTIAHVISFVHERRTDVPASAPAPAAPAAAPAGEDDGVRARVMEIVAEQTGYPSDMLELDLDLEADLGIDTVKQAETFAAIRAAYGIERDESLKLRDYPTIAHVIAFVHERRTDVPASAPAPAGEDDGVRARVMEIVAEQTGYPSDMLELDLDLEADLGIDTVKQAETFAAIRAAYGIERDESLKLRDYPTIAHVIAFVHERRTDVPAAAEPSQAATAVPTAVGPEIRGSMEDADRVPRRVPTLALRPALEACKPTGVELGSGSRVLVMSDRGGVGAALVRRLEKRGVEVLALDDGADRAALLREIEAWRDAGDVHGVYWLPALDDEGDHGELELSEWQAALALRVKRLYDTMRLLYEQIGRPGTFLVSATRLGGQHGYDAAGALCPMGGAVVGFTKAFKRERVDALVKAVDFLKTRKTSEVADALVAETLRDPGAVEIGVREGQRVHVSLREVEAAPAASPALLGPESVHVVTGAAGSIVSAIVDDLASANGGVFHLLDLTAEPDADDPELAQLVEDREGLKRTLFERLGERGERVTPVQVERELARLERSRAALCAIQAVERAGGRAFWHTVDLTDAAAVAKVVEEIRQRHARIDVLMHAAGMERSRLLPDKTPDEFDLVFDVKCDGWFNLMRAIGDTPLGATVVFSSIAGRFGNAGQADYSAANDLLCKCTSALRGSHPDTRAIAIDWTAWADIGMASRGSIPQAMAQAGIDMLPAAAGIPIVRRELGIGSGEVVIGGRLGVLVADFDPEGGLDLDAFAAAPRGPMSGSVCGLGLLDGLRVVTRLDPAEQGFLNDHRIDGTPVLPGVMGIEGFAEAAQVLCPELHVQAIEDVRFLEPFKFYRDEPRDVEICALLEPDGDGVVAHCRLVGRRQLKGQEAERVSTHFTARVRLGPDPAPEERAEPVGRAPDAAAGADDVYRVYFHGPAYRVLEAAWSDGDVALGRMAQSLPPNHAPSELPLLACPRLVELCFQTAGIHEIGVQRRMGLPMRIDRVVLPGGSLAPEAPVHAWVRVRADGDAECYEARVIDAEGRVHVKLEGYRTVALPDAIEESAWRPLRDAQA